MVGKRLIRLDEKLNPTCAECGTECVLIAFTEIEDEMVELAKERGFFMFYTEEEEPVMALCYKCLEIETIER